MKFSAKIYRPGYFLLWLSTGLGTFSFLAPWGLTLRLWMVSTIFLAFVAFLEFFSFGKIRNKKFVVASFLYWFAIVFSGFAATDTDAWFSRCMSSFLLVTAAVLISQIRTYQTLQVAVKSIIIFGGIFALIAIVEIPISFTYPEIYSFLHSFDIDGNPADKKLGTIAGLPRARGYFIEPNEFSQYLLLPTGLLMATGLISQISKQEILKSRLSANIFLVLILAQMLGMSRGGFLGIFVQLFVLYIIYYFSNFKKDFIFVSRLRSLIIFFICFLIFISVYFSTELIVLIDIIKYLATRLQTTGSSDDPTMMLRLSATFDGFNVWTQNLSTFIVGVGAGNLYQTSIGGFTTSNMIADIVAETGLLGLIGFIAIVINLTASSINKLIKIKKFNCSSKNYSIAIGAMLATAGLLMGGLTYSTHNLFILWLSFGMLAASNKVEDT